MDIALTWKAANEQGREQSYEFSFPRRATQPKWFVKVQPGMPREPYSPTAQDWDTLLQLVERQRARGTLSPVQATRIQRVAPQARRSRPDA